MSMQVWPLPCCVHCTSQRMIYYRQNYMKLQSFWWNIYTCYSICWHLSDGGRPPTDYRVTILVWVIVNRQIVEQRSYAILISWIVSHCRKHLHISHKVKVVLLPEGRKYYRIFLYSLVYFVLTCMNCMKPFLLGVLKVLMKHNIVFPY